jgi:alcohol dehydrogenase
MRTSYLAMQVAAPGRLLAVQRPVPRPGPGQVLIEVQACGVCGADLADIDAAVDAGWPPRVPGHEVVGRIAALGPGCPPIWAPGQRVGVGRLGGHCGACRPCRAGQFQLCQDQPFVGASCDGGYAEMLLVRATALVAIPEGLDAEEAAPILCAGLATFNALRGSGAQAGDLVAVQGIGGLGHMALQYAHRMGFRVAAIGRGSGRADDALALGAHVYIDSQAGDAAARLQALGGAQAVLATVGDSAAVAALLPGLAPRGRLVLLGAGRDPLPVSAGHLVVGERAVQGSITGTPLDSEKALDFSLLTGVRPRIQTLPLRQAQQAYARLKAGQARFRLVLTMGDAPAPGGAPANQAR